jgi:hypothetical protein
MKLIFRNAISPYVVKTAFEKSIKISRGVFVL